MKRREKTGERPFYVETPKGIFTANGHWFHTTRKKIEDYAPGLLKEQPLDTLVKDAETWLKSTDYLSLVLFMALAYSTNSYIAGFITLIFVPIWFYNKSAFVSYSVTKIFKIIEPDFVVFLVAVVVLSFKGIEGHYIGLIIGFIFFFFLKFGWFRLILEHLEQKKNKFPSLNDRLFKMIILKYALNEGITLGEINNWEHDIRQFISKKGKV